MEQEDIFYDLLVHTISKRKTYPTEITKLEELRRTKDLQRWENVEVSLEIMNRDKKELKVVNEDARKQTRELPVKPPLAEVETVLRKKIQNMEDVMNFLKLRATFSY